MCVCVCWVWFALVIEVSKKASERKFTLAPRLGHLHMYLSTDVFHCLPEEEKLNFTDRS